MEAVTANRKTRIEETLTASLHPLFLEVIDESENHHREGNETHFKIVCVSHVFEGLSLVARHRKLHELLESEMQKGLHAFHLQLLSPAEYEKAKTIDSPNCLGF